MDTPREETLDSPEQSPRSEAGSPHSPSLTEPQDIETIALPPPVIEKPVVAPAPPPKLKTSRKSGTAPAPPIVSLQRGLQLFEEIKMIQVTGEENIALKQLYSELHYLLIAQVQERSDIIAALEDELHRADESLNTWHASRTTARDAIDTARSDHAKDLQKLQDSHRSIIGELRVERQTQESMWTSNSDIRVERDQLREALAIAEREAINARRHHQYTLSSLEHSCLLERAMTKHAMQVKLRATREAMAASVGAGLGERTVQAVEESREGERELSKQGALAQAAMEEHQRRRETLKKARRELCLLVDALGHGAYRESGLQKEVKMYSARLEMLHQFMEREREGVEEYVRWKEDVKKEHGKNDRVEGENGKFQDSEPQDSGKPWELDTNYVHNRNKLRGLSSGGSTARPTLYPQQYRGGKEFHRPVTDRVLIPGEIQESRNREIVTAEWKFRKMRPKESFVDARAKRAVLPDSGSVSELEKRISSLITSIHRCHRLSKSFWAKAREYENRTMMIEGLQEESVRLIGVAEEDVRQKLLKHQLAKERAEMALRKKMEDEFDPVLNKSGLFSGLSLHNMEVSQGVRWDAREGIPPVLSKIDPRDVQQFLQMLRGQLEEPNTEDWEYDYDDDEEEDEDDEEEEEDEADGKVVTEPNGTGSSNGNGSSTVSIGTAKGEKPALREGKVRSNADKAEASTSSLDENESSTKKNDGVTSPELRIPKNGIRGAGHGSIIDGGSVRPHLAPTATGTGTGTGGASARVGTTGNATIGAGMRAPANALTAGGHGKPNINKST